VSRSRSNTCNPLAPWIDKNLGNPVVKKVLVRTLADRSWIRLLSVNTLSFAFLMNILDITKSQYILVTRAKPLLHVLIELMLIVECLLGYVMLQLLFNDV
jgi:hypothetical protein